MSSQHVADQDRSSSRDNGLLRYGGTSSEAPQPSPTLQRGRICNNSPEQSSSSTDKSLTWYGPLLAPLSVHS
jgi:hypothetical protein